VDVPVIEEANELDDTLRADTPPPPHSLATGIEFNDEESWESFSKSSPEKLENPLEDSQESLDIMDYSSPVIHPVHTVTYPRAQSGVLGNDRGYYTQASQQSDCSSTSPLLAQLSDPAPRPSTLISKLFPALNKPRQSGGVFPYVANGSSSESREIPSETRGSPSDDRGIPLTKAPSSASSDVDSGKESSLSGASALGDELRLKLSQLDAEILRYKTENSRIEKIRIYKEKVSQFSRSDCVKSLSCLGVFSVQVGSSRVPKAEGSRCPQI